MRSLRPRIVILLALALSGFAAADDAAPAPGEEGKQPLSSREVTVLRRQMRERESIAEAAFRNAETAFLVGEYDKAIEEFLMVSREYEDTSYRMRSVLRVGDVYYRQQRYDRAVGYYERAIRVPSELWWPEEVIEDYARADYMIGVCYFDQRAMNRAFAHFRRFTQRYPDSRFVDRAYDFIGRGNMEMKRYGQAIEAFRMVGTAGIQRDARRTIAPGDELYVRAVDADVGLATRHAVLPVTLTTTSGDLEILDLQALGLGSPVFIGTIRTRLGPPRLTKALDEAFPPDVQQRMDEWVATAAEMNREAGEREAELQGLRPPDEPREDATEQDRERYRADRERHQTARTRLETQIQPLRQGAQGLQSQAFRTLDQAFAAIETLLADWRIEAGPSEEPDESASAAAAAGTNAQASVAAAAGTNAQASVAAEEDGERPAASLSDTFTREQIEETRAEVRDRPTDERNFLFRKSVLSYWHRQLLLEHKTLDVKGNDTIFVAYRDAYGVEREGQVHTNTVGIASDAVILGVGPDSNTSIRASILGDDVRIKVIDADMSVSDSPDKLQVVIAAVPKTPPARTLEEGEPPADKTEGEEVLEAKTPSFDVFALEEGAQAEKPVLAPEGAPQFILTCVETGPHTGEFIGTFATVPAPDAPEAVLALAPEKIVRAAYRDARTASYGDEWVVVTELDIIPPSDGTHEVIEIQESQLDRRSDLEKGVALAKLGQVYQDLGLRLDAARVFDEAIRVVRRIVDIERDSPLGEEATFQLWEVYFASGDEDAAADACARLISAFPKSPLAPHALLIMAKAEIAGKTGQRHWSRGLQHLQRLVSEYGDSSLAPEAHFTIADVRRQFDVFDVGAFEAVVSRYPESNYAAQSLLRLGEYYVTSRDYVRARDYLERIALDFPDFDRLDQVSYMRGICAYRMGDIQQAYALMHETIERYPGTSSAQQAGRIVAILAERLKR